MKLPLKSIRKKLSSAFNITFIKHDIYLQLKQSAHDNQHAANALELLRSYSVKLGGQMLNQLDFTKSQMYQDLFVLAECDFRRNGFFVEFGATNGLDLSNTYLMEKNFGWEGILEEPAKIWLAELNKNRTAKIDTRSVWSTSDSTLQFEECVTPELSTIKEFRDSDAHKNTRKNYKTYTVNSVSLNDLLEQHKAPKLIDYLSIDTEGSEFDILNAFDFSAHKFKVITCEHNFTDSRVKIYDLLTSKGYIRKFEKLSLWDDWYVKA